MKRQAQRISARLVAVTLVGLAVSGAASVVEAAPSDDASCVAKLSVLNTRHPELFGTRADVAHDIKAETEAIGLMPGAFVSMVAQRSAPVEDCV